MSPRTVLRMAHGINDMRSIASSAHARIALQRSVCSHFFMELYISAAEALPEVEIPAEKPEEAEDLEFTKSFRWCMEIDVPERINLLVGDSASAPLRFLPPGRLMDLWYQFLSWCETQRLQAGGQLADGDCVPSWATFYRTWKALFHHRCLDFRPPSSHAECDTCFSFRQKLSTQRLQPPDRVRIATEWRQHLAKQYMDRTLYWAMRAASRTKKMDILVLIADSMDKAKWAYPKWPWHRVPHELENTRRPKMVSGHKLFIDQKVLC